MRTHANNAPLHIPPATFTSTPLTEQDVVGLFHQLSSLGVFSGIKIFATSQSQTYDCLVEYDCDHEQAGLLYKGKGGIFFTSRVFDSFAILSGTLYLAHSRGERDWLLESRIGQPNGTAIFLTIDPQSKHTLEEVLLHYATEQVYYAFNRTTIAIKLAISESEQLVSRSQAKRVSARLDKFKEVVLDFHGVASIGPAFADELFRVFAAQHPYITLIPVNANEEVTRMIRRASAGTGTDETVVENDI